MGQNFLTIIGNKTLILLSFFISTHFYIPTSPSSRTPRKQNEKTQCSGYEFTGWNGNVV